MPAAVPRADVVAEGPAGRVPVDSNPSPAQALYRAVAELPAYIYRLGQLGQSHDG